MKTIIATAAIALSVALGAASAHSDDTTIQIPAGSTLLFNGATTATLHTPPPPVQLSLSVDKPALGWGESAVLSWSAPAAKGCTASGGWSGARANNGTETISPAATARFDLACAGDDPANSDTKT